MKKIIIVILLLTFFFLPVYHSKSDIYITKSGGYYLPERSSAWQLLTKFLSPPDLKWIIIPEGLRKEEIEEKLTGTYGWDKSEDEGMLFPDTYLVPVKEKPQQTMARFRNRFNEKFAPYMEKYTKANIIWTTGLKIASLIQREAAGKSDMPIIAGVLWNRLDKEMKLEVDATVQYARGKTEKGWWSPIKISDKKIDSPYNTYIYKGLPPQPIGNPGLAAIDAVINYKETDCLFYLHDQLRQIHCAKTYEEHLNNIKKYL